MKMKKSRLLGILLSLVMVLGLMRGMSLTVHAAEKSETISVINSHQAPSEINTATGTHFKVTTNHMDGICSWGLHITKFGNMTVSSPDGTAMTKVVWSYESLSQNAGTLSASTGTYNGSNTVDEINSTSLTVSSTSPAGVWLNSITIYYEASNYSVTITPGNNMTKTTDSGAESQTDLSGAMTPVVYTANEGYYFPTNYSVSAVNGISVARDSYTQITVSGTPTADATITLTAATAKTDAAKEVINKINALPDAANVTTNHKTAIEAARTAFNALTDEEKIQVGDAAKTKLEAVEAALAVAEVRTAIENLPAASDVTTANKAAIEAARTAYNALSNEQKQAVGDTAKAKLEANEAALAIAELPAASAVTSANKDAIEAARTKYNALSDAQKTQVGAEAKAKLEADEVALAIAELPAANAVTTANKDAIEKARAAYNALSDAQKTQIGDAAKAKLEADEVALAIAELPAANAVTTDDKAAIEAARTAYEALSTDQKAQVGNEAKAKLEAVEVALVDKTIEALPAADNVTVEDAAAIEAARAAYDALTDAQKAQVDATVKEKLTAAENALAKVLNFSVSDGNNSTWTKGSSSGLTITFKSKAKPDTAFSAFQNGGKVAKVDGNKLSEKDFTYVEGSLKLTLNAAYLEALSAGNHKLTVDFKIGETKKSAEASFTIAEKSSGKKDTPKKDNVVTCQMAGYPANYAWNEAAKACQPGYLDANGVFHSTTRARVPNTYDKGIMGSLISLVSASVIAFVASLLLRITDR